MTEKFSKPFTQQEPIPKAGIARAVAVMQSGRLHRYNTLPGETSECEQLEARFAAYMGVPYCLACASGGYALHIALKAAGLETGDGVITNAFTLAPVPGAIHHAGGVPHFVEIDENYCVDLPHLEALMSQGVAKFFLISHMRGHLADMDAVSALCDRYQVVLIEDCAHTMGAAWAGKKSGTFGKVACFSTQTYKHLNSGEGGLLTTDDPNLMARAVMYSGSYMLYQRHGAVPDAETFNDIRLDTPNYSGRMDNLRAAILNAQLPLLDDNCQRWNRLYRALETALSGISGVTLPVRPPSESYVGSSMQFRLDSLSRDQLKDFIARCAAHGVELKWFGSEAPHGFTSRYDSWRYLGPQPKLEKTLKLLSRTLDLRLPLTFDIEDMSIIAHIIDTQLHAVSASN